MKTGCQCKRDDMHFTDRKNTKFANNIIFMNIEYSRLFARFYILIPEVFFFMSIYKIVDVV